MNVANWREKKKFIQVLDKTMAYVEEGQGDPILFLHGNPTSSFLWRNIIPSVADLGRCIAPDLIGMGDSDKLDNSGRDSYRFVEHRRYLDTLLTQLHMDSQVTLVLHDWGSGLGFDWAKRNPDKVKAIAYMEAMVVPVTWEDWPDSARNIFQALRSDAGEDMVLEKNVFVERILPSSILRKLSDEEFKEYKRPFLNAGEDRRPTLTWPREIPIQGDSFFNNADSSTDVVQIVEAYGQWLASSNIPKLFINAEPGAILIGKARDFCRTWLRQEEITVKGSHFIQEDSPTEIGQAIRHFIQRNDHGNNR